MSEQHPSSKKETKAEPPAENLPEANSVKEKKEIHVVSVPHENDMIAEEMAELFEEDQVTHQHGSAEPEGD
mgnify:FL=1